MKPHRTDEAMRRLESMLPPGMVIEQIYRSTSYGSRDRDGTYKPNVGSYRENSDSWCVDVTADGWEHERERWFQWGKSIRAACLVLAWSIRRVNRDPHLVHLGLEGPGEVVFEHFWVRGCAQCVDEAARIFDNKVEWDEDAA